MVVVPYGYFNSWAVEGSAVGAVGVCLDVFDDTAYSLVETLGGPGDAVLPRVSPVVGRKPAALLIESAGSASLH